MKLHALALGALLLATGLVQADPPAVTPAPEAAAETVPAAAPAVTEAKAEEKVCKLERQLGSNKMKRVCHTRAELDRQSESAREALSREQRR